MKQYIGGILPVLCLLMLLAHPSLACAGASQGLLLWAQVVLPTLLPFMICSGTIAALNGIPLLTGPFRPLLSGLLRLTDQGGFVFMTGLLCGYPMGAKMDSDFLSQGRLSLEEARYLLAISNHPSPMFAAGFAAPHLLLPAPAPSQAQLCPLWAFLAALYLPIFPLALLARHVYLKKEQGCGYSAGSLSAESLSAAVPFSFDEHLMSCLETMAKIGGYIMLFSILALYLTVMPLPSAVPSWLRPALLGFTEMTTGIQMIFQSLGPAGAPLIVASAAFGGLSGVFQTKSVLKNAGLSIRHYISWKLLHSALSCIFFYAAIKGLG